MHAFIPMPRNLRRRRRRADRVDISDSFILSILMIGLFISLRILYLLI